ncbi:MAG TPA: hypothetical protein VG937_27210 [Polyangiaceae bacterium]|nr:hypothetical protein [Polyangiaceae bacterium]
MVADPLDNEAQPLLLLPQLPLDALALLLNGSHRSSLLQLLFRSFEAAASRLQLFN